MIAVQPWSPGAPIRAERPEKPAIILIGGVSGSGKGHLAKQLARRLGILRVVSTDTVREVLRSIIPEPEAPCLHTSSFLAETKLPDSGERRRTRIIHGFEQQAALLLPSLKLIIERHRQEGEGLILEGVHLTPDVLVHLQHADTTILITAVQSRAEHQQRFLSRTVATSHRRAASHYLPKLGLIRLLQDHILLRATACDFPVLMTDTSDTLRQALHHVQQSCNTSRLPSACLTYR
jgi:2-phosphoglycerate kinase